MRARNRGSEEKNSKRLGPKRRLRRGLAWRAAKRPVGRESEGARAIHIALLRAVNLGPHKKVAMADLRAMLDDLGFSDVRSLINSGNLVFRGDSRRGASLERLLERETEKRLHLRTDYFVRTAREWDEIVERNPFPEEAKSDPGHLVLMLLIDPPSGESFKALQAAITGPEVVRAGGREAYITYPTGIGTSRLTNSLIEKKLQTRATGRNWNTVLKLAAMASG